ncbi:MAG TPA: carbon starvation CstA family protein, partial [Nitrospiria bacterium]|nr:carbon starvation CstA family protein [Nitrospiria bacterium]
MKILLNLVWVSLSLLGGWALAVIAGIVSPAEKVNGLWLVVAAACIYTLAYRFYGHFLKTSVVGLNNQRITPAHRLNDGKNFYPTQKYLLFGHHFAAVVGGGPLLGPILAMQFGFLPGLLWILIGTVLAGGVHDFIMLVGSMRRNGRSFPQIALDEVGPVTGMAAGIAVLLIVIIAMAGMGLAVVNALYHNPWGVLTISLTIPIGFFMGIYMKYLRPGKVGEITFIGIMMLIFSLIAGHAILDSPYAVYFSLERQTLIYGLAIYGFAAAVLPVWMLLTPRDYLSTFMKIGVVFLLAIGVLIIAPVIQMPPVTRFIHGGGPVIPGTLFPFMFITIACGALSGFHALVATGTTPKMIDKETDALPIGYGTTLLEGFVGVMAVIAAGIMIPGDYFAINSKLSVDAISQLGFPPGQIQRLSELVQVDVAGRPGGAVSLAVGMAYIFASIPGFKNLMAYWYQFALLFEALFILTTIDAGTRVGRFLFQEMIGKMHPPFKDIGWAPGAWITTFLVVFLWAYLISTGSIGTIWPMFGAANQLLGMLALCVGTTLIIVMKKEKYLWITLLPMIFMAITNFTAIYYLTGSFLDRAAEAPPGEAFISYLNVFLILLIGALAVIIL